MLLVTDIHISSKQTNRKTHEIEHARTYVRIAIDIKQDIGRRRHMYRCNFKLKTGERLIKK